MSNNSQDYQKGYQPRPATSDKPPKPNSGYQPASGHQAPRNPPNQGGSGKK